MKIHLKNYKIKPKKPQAYDSSLFIGQSYFFNDGTQLSLSFQTVSYSLTRIAYTVKIVSWKSKGLSVKKLATATATDNSPSPSIKWYRNLDFCFVFKKSCLKQKNVTYIPPNRMIFLLFIN